MEEKTWLGRKIHARPYRQDVGITLRVIVAGTMDDFDIDAEVLRENIVEYIEQLIHGSPLDVGVDELYARRGPSGSRFYHPGETPEQGLTVQFSSL